jgi:hypothetical protein
MNKKMFVGLVAIVLMASTQLINAATDEIITPDPSEPIEATYEEESNTEDYVKIGYVEAVFRTLGEGDLTQIIAYEQSVPLSDDDNDGLLETIVGVDWAILEYYQNTHTVFIIFSIRRGLDVFAIKASPVYSGKEGWNTGLPVTTTFKCGINEIGTFTTHIRAICALDRGHNTSSFTVSLGSGESYKDAEGVPTPIDMKIVYPSGTIVAQDIISVTAGDNIGEYYLHTANGQTYRIDDTIPAYLIE